MVLEHQGERLQDDRVAGAPHVEHDAVMAARITFLAPQVANCGPG